MTPNTTTINEATDESEHERKLAAESLVTLSLVIAENDELRDAATFAVEAFAAHLENEHKVMGRFYRPDAERAAAELTAALRDTKPALIHLMKYTDDW
jgi:hypothetical protein